MDPFKLLPVLFFLLLLPSSRAQTNCLDIDNRYTGDCEMYHENGALYAALSFNEGELLTKTVYTENGDKESEMEILDESGFSVLKKEYYSNNIVMMELDLLNGSGSILINYPSGKPKFEGKIRGMAAVNDWHAFDTDGKKCVELIKEGLDTTKANNLMALEFIIHQNIVLLECGLNEYYITGQDSVIVIDEIRKHQYSKRVPLPPSVESTNRNEPVIEVIVEEQESIEFPEFEAEFTGGEEKLHQFINDNIIYPEIAMELNEQGTVYVSFIVEKDGSLSNIKIESGVSHALDQEALRVVRLMPDWTPAESGGKVVRSECLVPINFTIINEKQEKKKKRKKGS